MKRSHTVGKLSSTKKTNTSVLEGKNNIKTSTNGKTSTSKPKNKTVSNFKAEEDGKKRTLVKSKTAKSLKAKKTDLSVDLKFLGAVFNPFSLRVRLLSS